MSDLITLDEAIEWGKSGELCDLMTEDDQRQIAEWLRQARGAESAARWYTAKLRELENENATLRQQLADVTESMGRVEERCAKLRELVKDALPFFRDDIGICVGGDCFAIWECCESNSSGDCPAVRRMWERARELGIEVD